MRGSGCAPSNKTNIPAPCSGQPLVTLTLIPGGGLVNPFVIEKRESKAVEDDGGEVSGSRGKEGEAGLSEGTVTTKQSRGLGEK